MLLELHVRGLGPLRDATVSFAPGLNVLSGETGTGKTLLVTSLTLLAGARSEAHLGEASLEAVVRPTERLRAALAERGFDAAGELVLARRTGPRSRAWVYGSLVPAGVLAEIGEHAFEVHGQGQGFALARPQAQIDALDVFAGTLELRAAYERDHAAVRALDAERATIVAEERERARAIDVLGFQVEEIERARLDPESDEELRVRLCRLENAERLGMLAGDAVRETGSDGASGAFDRVRKELAGAVDLDPALSGLAARAASLAAEGAELAADLRTWSETLEADPAELQMLRERDALVSMLKRKYGETLADVLVFAAEAHERLAALQDSDNRLSEIDVELERIRHALDATAASLTSMRSKAAKDLGELVTSELPALALPGAVFEIAVEPLGPDGGHGRDRVEFRFTGDRSRPPGSLGRIASGGELSRVMIAVTLALARAHEVPTLVFDEADQGVGGQAALELARRLALLGRTHQVLVVTHLPQIAAFADRHLVVEDSHVRAVEGTDRVGEISRMLAGLGDSDRARSHAEELIELAETERKKKLKPMG